MTHTLWMDTSLTSHSRESLFRIAEGLRTDSSQRAWRITGNYGAGKSSFALLLAHWLSGAANNIPSDLKSELSYRKLVFGTPHLVPILVTGSRIAMSEAISRSLIQTLEQLYSTRRTPKEINDVIKGFKEKQFKISENQLINAFRTINNRIIADELGSGLLLIIDELGKFLEFVGLHTEQQDVYLLQSLAEIASRSMKKPLFVIGLLHQGFQAYSHNLSEFTQREWGKVAARFEQILFDQPLEQVATLISSALNITTTQLPGGTRKDAILSMERALALGWFGSSNTKSMLVRNADKIYPLHPTVLPVLARIFRRFGQNERSLFGFLLSNEPSGLQSFSERPIKAKVFFRLYHLYDYVRINFGHSLSIQSYRSHWNQIDSMIQSYMTDDPIELRILKTVGILNLLDSNDLIPSEDVIQLALAGITSSKQASKKALSRLCSRKKILHHRGALGGYCLWPYTSVNLELAYEKAANSIPAITKVVNRIAKYIETKPVVARRHYIETGNLRYFEVSYSPISEIPSILKMTNREADGLIIIPLCETEEERQIAFGFAFDKNEEQSQNIVVAIPPPLNNLAGLLTEVERWEWVSRNTQELVNDRFASEEVSRQTKAALATFNKRLCAFVDFNNFHGEISLECFYRGKKLPIRTWRDLLQQLSLICDNTYPNAPCIKNELVNRQALSSAASGARMRLIERMLSFPGVERLGMDENKRPPEMSMYLSILKAAKIHHNDGRGWQISKPSRKDDIYNVSPTWDCINSILKVKSDRKVPITEIFDVLRNPPYGVREGLIPIFLAAFIVENQEQIALYEHKTFIPTIESEEFLRLTKAPDTFHLQYCSIGGIRSEILEKLHSVITGEKKNVKKPAILEIVKPLCVFVASLPEYTRFTKRMHSTSIAVRQTILSTRDPFSLLFKELPTACSVQIAQITKSKKSEDETRNYVLKLKRSLTELRIAYSQLIDRIQENISVAFSLSSIKEEMRKELHARSSKVLIKVTEPRLRSFCVRLSDEGLQDNDWLQSVGSFLASRPPSKWRDNDEETFVHELSLLASRFKRIEGLTFDENNIPQESVDMKITITRPDGDERDRVLYFRESEEKEIDDLQRKIEELLNNNNRLGVVAASRVLWRKLS